MQMAVLEGESKYLGGNKRRETCFGRSDRQVASRESDKTMLKIKSSDLIHRRLLLGAMRQRI